MFRRVWKVAVFVPQRRLKHATLDDRHVGQQVQHTSSIHNRDGRPATQCKSVETESHPCRPCIHESDANQQLGCPT